MQYNGQQNCYPLQEVGGGGGVILTGRFSVPCILKHEMKPKRAGSKPVQMSERGLGVVVQTPGSSVLGTGPSLLIFEARSTGPIRINQTVLSDILPCLQGSLRTFRLNPLSIWFVMGEQNTEHVTSSTTGWELLQRVWCGLSRLCLSHMVAMKWIVPKTVKDLSTLVEVQSYVNYRASSIAKI